MEDLGMTFSWRDRNVFVTGATGLLGASLVEELLHRGANVTVLMRDQVAKSRFVSEGFVNKVSIVRGKVEDFDLLLRAFNEHEIDTVFHLAAQTIVGTAHRSVLSTFETNIQGTWCLLEACRQLPTMVKRVIITSSDKAYGVSEDLPYTEESPLLARYPYDVSKSCADLIAFSFHETFGVPVAITRCGNLYGAGDLNWNRIVPGTIRSVLHGERPVIRSDGTLRRDYIYVEDAVAGYLNLAERAEELDLFGQAFNFGNGEPVTVLDFVRAIQKAAGSELEPEIQGQVTGEIPAQWLDTSKIQRLLGFKPRFEMAEALGRTVAWYRAHLGLA